MKKIVFAILSFLAYSITQAQTISVAEYIATYKDIAISEMKRSGIPASITLAQGMLETENGNSDLVQRSSNHFGIKCKNTWTGASVFHDDDAQGECFRKYENAIDSYKDHSDFLRNSSRYAFLFDLDPTDYKGWAYGLKKAGYATNPKYPVILIRNIEENNLQQYDRMVNNEGNVTITDRKNVVEEMKPAENVSLNQMGKVFNLESIKAGKTLFNGLKAVFVPKGISLLAIATEFDISLSKLMEYNDLKTDGLLKEEQWIFLERKLKQGNRDFYITEAVESLYGISQTNAIQLESLVQFNNLRADDILKRGTKIRLRPGKDLGNLQRSNTNEIIHKVQSKEGLYSISKKYNVSEEKLKQLNNLSMDGLKVGQELIISK